MKQLLGIRYVNRVSDTHHLRLCLFALVNPSHFELDVVKFGAVLKAADVVLEIADSSFLFLNNWHPQNSSHFCADVQVHGGKFANFNGVALAWNSNHVQFVRFLFPDFLKVVAIVNFGSAFTLEQVDDHITPWIEHELGLILDQYFSVRMYEIHLVVLEHEDRQRFVHGVCINANVVGLRLQKIH